MRVLYGPLITDARGRFGGIVASAWKGTRLVRRYREPANPDTALQKEVRRIFANLTRAYVAQQTDTRAAWEAYADGKTMIGRNVMVKKQVPILNGETDCNLMVGTPGDASTIGCTHSSAPGAGAITVTITEPSPLPTGWTITRAVAYCFKDSDWSTLGVDIKQTEGNDASSPYEVVLTGLDTVAYQVRAFLVWLAPDGTTRFSISSADQATPT